MTAHPPSLTFPRTGADDALLPALRPWTQPFLCWLRIAVLANAVWIWGHGLAAPLNDQHAFRQTHTMISVERMEHGGPLLFYETPVLGVPWQVPLEFPLYQWAVLLLRTVTHLSLDACGRLVSLAAFLALLAIGPSVLQRWGASRTAASCWQILMGTSGTYLFWSRTTLIDPMALLLAISSLGLLHRVLDDRRPTAMVAAVIITALALATKPPTILPVLGLATAWVLPAAIRREDGAWRWLGCLAVAAVPFLLWTGGAAVVRDANPFGGSVTSWTWNFGSFDQKSSIGSWTRYLRRTLNEGAPFLLRHRGWPTLVLLLVAPSRRLVAALVAAFLFVPLVFTNVHFVHNYYPYANLCFLLAALAVAYADLLDSPRTVLRVLGAGLLLLAAVTSRHAFLSGYAWERMNRAPEPLAFAAETAHRTGPDDLLILFGNDWTSYYHYYADRRGLAVPEWAHDELSRRALGELEQAGHVGAVFVCGPRREQLPWIRSLWPSFDAFDRTAVDGDCDLYFRRS